MLPAVASLRSTAVRILAYTLVSLENHHPETIREFDQLVKDVPNGYRAHFLRGRQVGSQIGIGAPDLNARHSHSLRARFAVVPPPCIQW